MTTFYKNFVQLCAAKNVSLSAAAEAIGLSRTSPNGWKKGKQPSDVTLAKLADYFGCSVADLTTDKTQKPAPSDGNEPNKLSLDEIIETMDREQLIDLISRATELLREK